MRGRSRFFHAGIQDALLVAVMLVGQELAGHGDLKAHDGEASSRELPYFGLFSLGMSGSAAMQLDASEAQMLRDLEERLLRPEVRSSAEAVAALLADEFVEFGSSGGIYDKSQIVALLQQERGQGGQRTVRDFAARQLADGVVLVTYRVVESRTIRSSIWKCMQGRWQMVFHQGTRSPIP